VSPSDAGSRRADTERRARYERHVNIESPVPVVPGLGIPSARP
jgi:hypothetical protein